MSVKLETINDIVECINKNEAFFVNTDKEYEIIIPKNNKDFKYKELTDLIKGNLEIVNLTSMGKIIILDEEGKNKNLPINEVATALYKTNYLNSDIEDIIVGNVIICNPNMIK